MAHAQNKKKIIFLMSDTGGGHRSVAESITLALNEIYSDRVNAKMIDFLSEGNKTVAKLMKTLYSKANHYGSLWYGILFYITNNKISWKIVSQVYRLFYRKIKRIIMTENPDMIIVVHSFANPLVKKISAKLMLNIPLIAVITEPVTFHISWIERCVDYFIVPGEEAKERLLREKIPEKKIMELGFPIKPVFYNQDITMNGLLSELDLKKDKFTVLFTGGGEGGGKIYPIVRLLLKEKLDIQIIVVCGRNLRLKGRLSKFPIVVTGYIDKMHKLMAIADIVIAKAGPATIEECIASGLPIILTSYIIGHEDGNVEYAKKRTRAYYETNPKKVVELIKMEFLNKRDKLPKIPKEQAPVYKIANFIIEVVNQ